MNRMQKYRTSKPIEELVRKSDKAVRKSKLWTQEEIDLGIARGKRLAKLFAEEPDN